MGSAWKFVSKRIRPKSGNSLGARAGTNSSMYAFSCDAGKFFTIIYPSDSQHGA